MQQRKIVNLTARKSNGPHTQSYRHVIMLTYDDTTKKEIFLFGDELSRILNKNFKSITLTGPVSENFILEDGYFGYKVYHETLPMKDVIALFNERGYLVDIDDKRNLFELDKDYKNNQGSISQSKSPTLFTKKTPEKKKDDKLITKSYNPTIYHLRSMSDKNKKPANSNIEINFHTDEHGPFIEYRLIGMDKKEVSGIIRQEDIPDTMLPSNIDEVIKNDDNCEKWLNLILDVTTKRGHTNKDHTPPPVELGPFLPYVPPKGWLRYDEDKGMYFYDNSLSQHLKQAGLFATKAAAVVLVGYGIYLGLKP